MNTPRLLMGAALLFWGWQTGFWFFGLALAAALEAERFTRTRWELSDKDLNRICDLCFVLLLGAALVLYSTEDRVTLIFKFAQSLPLSFFPIALAQAYGNRRTMPLSVFSPLLRRVPQSSLARNSFNVSYPYFALCLLAASAATQPNQFFYPGVAVLILLALSGARPRRVSRPVWLALAAAVFFCGQFSHRGLRELQVSMETALGGWLANWFHPSPDSKECLTLIGHSGPIKLSDKIVLRVQVPPGDIPPGLLRECAYDSYRNTTWSVVSNVPGNVNISVSGSVRFLESKPVFSSVEIAAYFPGGKGVLPLPQGVFQIEDVPAFMQTNRLGVVEVSAAPGLLDYHAEYWPGTALDSPPDPMDLSLPARETNVLGEVAALLGLEGMTERQKIRAVSRFFHDNFRYSLNVPGNTLARFLTETHAGHCEYFATATVLLLRQAGVRARYATGYAVPETTRPDETILVRERHAHAWALVYHSDSQVWEPVDNTPAAWMDVPEARPPWWEPASDFLSKLYFEFSKWRWSKTSFARYAQWAVAPLILWLVWSIVSTGRRHRPADAGSDGAPEPPWPGLDSELYQINQRLAEVRLARLPNEPLALWQKRLEAAYPASPALPLVFQLHRRLRFDPHGLQGNDRAALRRQAWAWLAEFSAAHPSFVAPKQ